MVTKFVITKLQICKFVKLQIIQNIVVTTIVIFVISTAAV